MSDIVAMAEQLSSKNDKYLFIVTLIILAFATFFAIRWLVNKLERSTLKAEENQNNYNTSLLNISASYNKTMTDIAVVLAECRDVIQENTDSLRRGKQ